MPISHGSPSLCRDEFGDGMTEQTYRIVVVSATLDGETGVFYYAYRYVPAEAIADAWVQ